MILPETLKIQYCFDGLNFPELFEPTVCIMRVRELNGEIVGKFQVCTAVHDPETPNDIFWVRHNSILRERVQPFAYLVLAGKTNTEFLTVVAKFKTLSYNLKIPY
jgi:hypothetical protein